MKKILTLIAYIALASCLSCSGGYVEKQDQNYNPICVEEVENCQVYNSEFPQKCFRCVPGYQQQGSQWRQYEHCCKYGLQMLNDEAGSQQCGKPILGCETYQTNNISICKTCGFGFTGTEVAECTCNKKVRSSFQIGETLCVEEIPNCEVYYNQDGQIVCKYCIKQAQLNEDENNCCLEPKKLLKDDNQAKICALPIKNCKIYLNTDPSKCQECDYGFTGAGGEQNAWESCTCDSDIVVNTSSGELEACEPKIPNCVQQRDGICDYCDDFSEDYNNDKGCCPFPKIIVKTEQDQEECVDEITGCEVYLSTDPSKCQACHSSFATGNGTSKCECEQGKIVSQIKEGYRFKYACVNPIPNCKQYDEYDLNKCKQCSGFSKLLGPDNTTCCKYPQEIKKDETDADICLDVIPGCEVYLSTNTARCYACIAGFTGSGGEGDKSWESCDCAHQLKRDYTGRQLCVENELENCILYANNNTTLCASCTYFSEYIGSHGAYEKCCKSGEETVKMNENDQEMCAKHIPGCQKWLSTDSSKCHTCDPEEFELSNEGSCTCKNNQNLTLIYKDYKTQYSCIPTTDQIPNCSVYNAEKTKCKTCKEGTSLVKENLCVVKIIGCKTYSETQNGKCHTCTDGFTGKGTPQAYDSCECDHFIVPNQEEEFSCTETLIPNCKNYLNISPNLCYECEDRHEGIGPFGAYESCCQGGMMVESYFRLTEKYTRICKETMIEGCMLYLSSNPEKCHTCSPGFTGQGGSQNAWDSCSCDSKTKVRSQEGHYICANPIQYCERYNNEGPQYCADCEFGTKNIGANSKYLSCKKCPEGEEFVYMFPQDKICAPAIPNCERYNGVTKKCHTCKDGFTSKGGSAFSYESCECDSPFEINRQGDCALIVENCKNQDTPFEPLCEDCLYGYTYIGEFECVCDEGKSVFKNNLGDDVCLLKEIPYCEAYLEDSDNCHTCLPGFSGKPAHEFIENEYTECTCEASRIKQNVGKTTTFCQTTDIPNCKTYASPTTCHACTSSTEFVLSSDGKSCSPPPPVAEQPQTSESSQVLNLSLIMVLLSLIIIIL